MNNRRQTSSFEICRRITRRSRSSFVAAFRFLSQAKRDATIALYAFMRFTDDLADDVSVSLETRRRRLTQWRLAVSSFFAFEAPDSSNLVSAESNSNFCGSVVESSGDLLLDYGIQILPALADVVQKYNVPTRLLFDVIDGVSLDLAPSIQMNSLDDSLQYCDLVATAVGTAILAIFQTERPLDSSEIQAAAKAFGRAFQWTNFLRDVREDVSANRFYFPLDDFRAVSLTPIEFASLIREKKPFDDERVERFLEIQFRRTDDFYRRSSALFPFVCRDDGRFVLFFMRRVYFELFSAMRKSPETIFRGRRRFSAFRKLSILLKSVWIYRRENNGRTG